MTVTVEQTQSDLTGMIRLARGGEDVVITEGGNPVAKLTAIAVEAKNPNRREWLAKLRELREKSSTGKIGLSSDEILNEDRSGRG